MKRINTQLYPLGLAAIALSLAGCAGLRSAADAPPTPAALQALEQVQTDYQAGRYGDVIKYVAKSDDLATAPASVRVPALKLQAFSYCVSKYVPLCEDTFSRILAIDPSFELSPSEAGHPVWGAAFKRVKN